MKKIHRVLLDLDCVLADFIGPAARLWGFSFDQLLPHWPPGHYGMELPLTRALRAHQDPEAPEVTTAEFWRVIGRAGAAFWEGLPRAPWASQLLALVDGLADDWHVVTTPSRCPTSYAGKVAWLKREFGAGFDRFAITPHKGIFAKPGVVLVDDHGPNVATFRLEGGDAVLFPAWHNELHHTLELCKPLDVARLSLEARIMGDRDSRIWTL